jgi:hypothetical protein
MGQEPGLTDRDLSDPTEWRLTYAMCLTCGNEWSALMPIETVCLECPVCEETDVDWGDHCVPIGPKPAPH